MTQKFDREQEISSKFKLVSLGESGVGKSSLVLQFVKGQFHEIPMPTIGAAFLTKTVCLEEETVTFEIWDTAGQERFNSILPMYYRGAHAAIVVYDITMRDTFERAKGWVDELQRNASQQIVIAFLGNKVDLTVNRSVTYDEASAYAKENELLFMETSAKTTLNVTHIFTEIAEALYRKMPMDVGEGFGGKRLSKGFRKKRSCCRR